MNLIHWTKNAETITKVISTGFLLIPSKKGVMKTLLPEEDFFQKNEPQPFGMVCFTDIPFYRSWRHHLKFGCYGIAMSREWTSRHNIKNVRYIGDNTPNIDGDRQRFREAFADAKYWLSREYPNDAARPMGFIDKNAARYVLGSGAWAAALEEIEYLETIDHKWESEWRAVQNNPIYCDSWSIESVTDMCKWGFSSLKISNTSDIEYFICPQNSLTHFTKILPENFKSVPTKTFWPWQASLWRVGANIWSKISLTRKH